MATASTLLGITDKHESFKMKYSTFFTLLVIHFLAGCSRPITTTTPTTDEQRYRLTWADELNGSAVDTTVWTFETGNSGWGNNEHQFYQAANATVNNGGVNDYGEEGNYRHGFLHIVANENPRQEKFYLRPH